MHALAQSKEEILTPERALSFRDRPNIFGGRRVPQMLLA